MNELNHIEIKNLRFLKDSVKAQAARSHLQITYLFRDLHLEYIKNFQK